MWHHKFVLSVHGDVCRYASQEGRGVFCQIWGNSVLYLEIYLVVLKTMASHKNFNACTYCNSFQPKQLKQVSQFTLFIVITMKNNRGIIAVSLSQKTREGRMDRKKHESIKDKILISWCVCLFELNTIVSIKFNHTPKQK